MKIYTSYIANIPNLKKDGIVPCTICAIPPKGMEDSVVNIGSVAPSKDILFEYKNNPNQERYRERYINEILCAYRFHPEYLTQFLERIGEGNDVAMCCYEKPDDFCHRHILAEWLSERTDYQIEEYQNYPKEYTTDALF